MECSCPGSPVRRGRAGPGRRAGFPRDGVYSLFVINAIAVHTALLQNYKRVVLPCKQGAQAVIDRSLYTLYLFSYMHVLMICLQTRSCLQSRRLRVCMTEGVNRDFGVIQGGTPLYTATCDPPG